MSVDTSVATSDLDLFAEEVLADRDPYFAKLREIAPVVYLPANDAYALTRSSGPRSQTRRRSRRRRSRGTTT